MYSFILFRGKPKVLNLSNELDIELNKKTGFVRNRFSLLSMILVLSQQQ